MVIKAVAENCPEVMVGADTIVNVERAKRVLEMDAKFIVSPGFSDEVVFQNNAPQFFLAESKETKPRSAPFHAAIRKAGRAR